MTGKKKRGGTTKFFSILIVGRSVWVIGGRDTRNFSKKRKKKKVVENLMCPLCDMV